MNQKLHALLTALLLVIFIPSTFLLVRNRINSVSGEKAYQEAVQIALQTEAAAPVQATSASETTEAPTVPTEIQWIPKSIDEHDDHWNTLSAIDLDALRETNPDVLGWILIPDTPINYPVLQGKDNDYYLEHTWDNKNNYMGSIFLEASNNPDFSDFNTIVYGHNLSNGAMFSAVRKFRYQNFYDDHPHVYLVTDQGIFRYEIYSSHLAPLDSMTYGMVMLQEQTRQAFLDYTMAESVIETPVVPGLTDSILTLSTCSGQGYSTRWAIHARLENVPAMVTQ